MDKEVSSAFSLAVTLCAIAVTITIIWVTVGFGTDLRSSAFDYLSDVDKQVDSSMLNSLNGLPTTLPSAGAYNVLKGYSSIIDYVECHVTGCGEVTEGTGYEPCIVTHLRGKVILDVSKGSDGYFSVEVHKDTCTILTGRCNCN